MIATASTFEVWPILMRVLMPVSTASVKSNTPASVVGFFSTRNAIRLTPASAVLAPIGTTAPFSAMSGAVITISLLSTGLAMPRALITSSADLPSKAALP